MVGRADRVVTTDAESIRFGGFADISSRSVLRSWRMQPFEEECAKAATYGYCGEASPVCRFALRRSRRRRCGLSFDYQFYIRPAGHGRRQSEKPVGSNFFKRAQSVLGFRAGSASLLRGIFASAGDKKRLARVNPMLQRASTKTSSNIFRPRLKAVE